MAFKIHTPINAPDKSAPLLREVEKKYGFVPNLMGVFAEAPEVLKAYLSLSELFQNTSLSQIERNVAVLTVSFENRCAYCMSVHSAVAQMESVPKDVVENLRKGSPLRDGRLNALRNFTATVVKERGWVSEAQIKNFIDAGYSQRNVLEIILGVTMKTLSNYVNHVAKTPLDSQFAQHKWSPEGK